MSSLISVVELHNGRETRVSGGLVKPSQPYESGIVIPYLFGVVETWYGFLESQDQIRDPMSSMPEHRGMNMFRMHLLQT